MDEPAQSRETAPLEVVEHIRFEPEFKELCDALLRLEVGPLVQLYGGKGADGGVDADYIGTFDGVEGRWVFQYKFVHPSTDPSTARARLKSMFVRPAGGGKKVSKKRSEFEKPGVQGACGYVLMTNVAATAALTRSLRVAFAALHPEAEARFCIWDPASMNAMLRAHPHLARSRSQAMEELCLQEVIEPLWEWVGDALAIVDSWNEQEQAQPLWPIKFSTKGYSIARDGVDEPFERRYKPRLAPAPLPASRDDRVFEHAATIAFPVALRGLDGLERAYKGLVHATANCVYQHANELRRADGCLQAFTQEERDGMALGVAVALIRSVWGHGWYLPSFRHDSIMVESRYIYEGERAELAKEPIYKLLAELRVKYDHGKKLPARVLRARARFAESLYSFAGALWHPAVLGMDAPVEAEADEPALQ